ncbi:cardiolipin synthase [Candidatus Latescibacterota bacterium]
MMFSWSLAYIISEWVIRLVMLVVVTRRRRPNSAMAWLLVIFFQPWVGLGLYLLIGRNRLPHRRVERHSRLLAEFQALGRRFENHPHIVHPQLAPEQMSAVTLAQHLGFMPILGGNDLELISGTEDVIDRLIADIDAAEHHVHLLFYIFADDETGGCVAAALYRAVKRGVTCRVLVDAVGSRSMIKTLGARMIEQGIEIHATLPVNILRFYMARIDLRNHRKLAVIDGYTAYTGSQNIVNPDYGHKDLAWHDLMVRMTGPIVLELQAVFLVDWYHETGEIFDSTTVFPEPPVTGKIPLQALPSGPNYPIENYQRIVVDALHSARKNVIITTPYFVPDEAFMQAIQIAALRGVEIEVIVPNRYDQILVGAASRSYYDDLLDAGVKLYLYTDGLVHAKTMSIDNAISFIGTSNFDIRSFSLNFEINLALYGSDVTCELRAEQNKYREKSIRLTGEEWKKRPAAEKVFQNIAKLLSPLL